MGGLQSEIAERAQPNRASLLLSLAPSVAFLAANSVWGLVPGMLAASSVSLGAIAWRRRRHHRIGWLLPGTLAYVVLRGIAGVVTESEAVFFGSGLVLSALIALAVGATAFTRRPIALYLLPLVVSYRRLTPDHGIYRRVAAHVTAAWAVAELTLTGWEAWHLSQASAAEFVVTRTIVAWPVMAVIIFFLIFYVRFRLDPIDRYLAHQPA